MSVIEKDRKAAAPRAGQGKGKPVRGRPGAEQVEEAAVQVEAKGQDVLVPLERLVLSAQNVRKLNGEQGLAELAALIEAHGLLQRLSVVALPDGRFAVVAGGRRLRALQLLAEQGRWPGSQPVECKVYPSEQAVQVSLAESSGHEAMHPADQMEAFRHLIEQERLTIAQVAHRFGVSLLTVERRLRLARLAPGFIDLYRAGQIALEQLQALALTDDPALQQAAWDGLPGHDRSPRRLRAALTASACSAAAPLARFVGLDVYEVEGGTLRRDLFADSSDHASVYLDDPGLLQRLATNRLRYMAQDVKAEGWAWVEYAVSSEDEAPWSFRREAAQGTREATGEEAQALERLAAEHAASLQAYDQHLQGDDSADDFEEIEYRLSEAVEAAEEKLSVAREALRQWTPEQMARAGARIRIDYLGQAEIERGLVRRDEASGEGPGPGPVRAARRRLTRTARPEFSEPLMRDLTAHRTAAIQAALMHNPRIALVTLVHRMAETVFGLYGRGNDVVKVTVHVTGDGTLGQDASDYAQCQAATLLAGAQSQWGDRLPGSPGALFGWLLAQPEPTLMELLAYCTARSFNAVGSCARTMDHSDALAEVLGVDMCDWWKPTVASYFGRISRTQALDAFKDATGNDATHATRKMKKDEVAAYCARVFQEVRWVPGPMRPIRSARAAEPRTFDEDEQ